MGPGQVSGSRVALWVLETTMGPHRKPQWDTTMGLQLLLETAVLPREGNESCVLPWVTGTTGRPGDPNGSTVPQWVWETTMGQQCILGTTLGLQQFPDPGDYNVSQGSQLRP